MKIQWLGHSAFALTSHQGTIIITDPYDTNAYNGDLRYGKINVTAHIVTVSHKHPDHYTANLPGNPQVLDKEGAYSINDIKITGIPAFHDQTAGKERGKIIIFIYEIDGLRIAHLGDLGHIPTKDQYAQIGIIDILLIPVGGYFTIDAVAATQIATDLKAKIVIPMHYKTDKLDFPITTAEPFLKGKTVKTITTPETTIDKNNLPQTQEVWVLPYQK
jgi:L-ascorbate metabolism protein UlaG (beta-lactamase superfamily)